MITIRLEDSICVPHAMAKLHLTPGDIRGLSERLNLNELSSDDYLTIDALLSMIDRHFNDIRLITGGYVKGKQ